MRPGGRSICIGVLATLAICPAALVAERPARESWSRIDVLLTTAPTLSKSARASMINEASAIWRRHGVELDWVPPNAERPVASNRLRVLIVPKQLMVVRSADLTAVGELVRPPNGHAIALISIESAQHLVASVRGRAGYGLIAVDEGRFGIVLGRALAHEIGHYLLDTHTHAQRGLMRQSFNALEFTDPRDDTFALDHDAADWLRSRSVEKFAYAHR